MKSNALIAEQKDPRKLYLEWAVERWNDRADVEEDS